MLTTILGIGWQLIQFGMTLIGLAFVPGITIVLILLMLIGFRNKRRL